MHLLIILALLLAAPPAGAADVSASNRPKADKSNNRSPPLGWPANMAAQQEEAAAPAMTRATNRRHDHTTETAKDEVGVFNIVDLGADPTGKKDSAPAFRLAVGSNRIILVPPGTYTMKTTQPSGYAYLDPTTVLFRNVSNFVLDMKGAVLTVSDEAAYTSILMFDRATDFRVVGGTLNGNHTGVLAEQESAGIVGTNIKDFVSQGQHFGGNWGGQSTAYAGD